MVEIKQRYHRPPPDDYDAVKHFRQQVEELERALSRDTDGRVVIKSIMLEHNWELWEAPDGSD